MELIIFAGAEFAVVTLFIVCAEIWDIKRKAGESHATARCRSSYATVLRRYRVGALSGA